MKWALPGALPGLRAFRIPFRLRFFFRAVFAALALITLALALTVLQDEKERSQRVYAQGLQQNQAQIAARLRHPTGQLMLLNPEAIGRAVPPVVPLVLPFAALDFDDRFKAQQAVEMAGCNLQYPDGSTLCTAVGGNPYAGGFVYVVGSLTSAPWVSRRSGELDLTLAHRALVELTLRDGRWRWIAPFEATPDNPLRGRLVGFDAGEPVTARTRPQREFRGWLWQEGRCVQGDDEATCPRRTFYSVRLPVAVLQQALATRPLVWPPRDLSQMQLRVQLLPAGETDAPLFDSHAPGAQQAFSVADLKPLLQPGETLTVKREGEPVPLLRLTGSAAPGGEDTALPWIDALIRRLPVRPESHPALNAVETIATPLGRYEIALVGDLRPVERQLAAVATRLSGFVGAMLAAVLLTWLAIEITIIRRVTLLTQRAAAVSSGVRGDAPLPVLEVAGLRGSDELGVLSQGLHDLLQRVNDDVRREQIRAAQEKDQWHAVGHEIMSPLQSLMALHGSPGDPAERYITRMQQAVRVLYGQASPSEAFESTTLDLQPLDLNLFLQHVAGNAAYIGITGVVYEPLLAPLMVRANEYALEDVVTHLLKNAERHRLPGTPIRISARILGAQAMVRVHNQGPAIEASMLERIFEYGVSGTGAGAPRDETGAQRGQGLFVVRTYMAKMGGTVVAQNLGDGVVFELGLALAA
jgi:signal transduction histidine kinase